MNVSIVGITGFIGSRLGKCLMDDGNYVTGIYRRDINDEEILKRKIDKSDVVINVSGAPIAGFWTKRKKRRIYESRVLVTRKIAEIINLCKSDMVFINASAVGIYDNRNIHSEESIHFAKNFLADVVTEWEREVWSIDNKNVRAVILRMGVVISESGGYLGMQNFLLKRGICIIAGKKDEYLPLISLDELLNIIRFIISNKNIKGVVNAVAPFMVTIDEFYHFLIRFKAVKIIIRIPDFFVRFALGKASVIFLKGQCVIPEKLIMKKYEFIDRGLSDILKNILKSE